MEPLADPLDDRMCKEVSPPPVLPLSTSLLFPTKGNEFRVVYYHHELQASLG